jgi:hypothetical protein
VNLRYGPPEILRGALIYSAGDTIASLIQSCFSPWRLLGMMIIGGTVYAFEIPNWFRWIDLRTASLAGTMASMARTGLAILYFNPFWIARHLLFIAVISGDLSHLGWALLRLGVVSFAVNAPFAFAANYLIQNRVPLRFRFAASATFSSLMAVYYALSATLFGS